MKKVNKVFKIGISKKNGEKKTILFNLCGHGHFDMTAYSDYFDNKLADDIFEEEQRYQWKNQH